MCSKTVVYLRGIVWGTEGGTQGNNVIMGWAIVINTCYSSDTTSYGSDMKIEINPKITRSEYR